MASKAPAWQVGDAVYALLVDPDTGLYKVHGVGRVMRIEGGTMHLATKKGPKTWGVTDWPAFKSRADGEAYCVEHPGPNHGRLPMAHHDAPSPKTEKPTSSR